MNNMIDKCIKYIKWEFKLRFINQIEINPSNDETILSTEFVNNIFKLIRNCMLENNEIRKFVCNFNAFFFSTL